MADEAFYWCMEHDRVEEGAGCPANDRLGPYDTREAARDHAERTASRNKSWESGDREWEEQNASDSWERWD